MSMSTEHGGGSRRPTATKAIAGGKPNLSKDADEDVELDLADEDVELDLADEIDEEDETSAPKATTRTATKSARSTTKRSTATRSAIATAAKKTGAAKKPGARPATRPGAGSAVKAGPRRVIAPMKVSQGRNWGPIALFTVVIVAAVGIVGYAGWQVYEKGLTVAQRVERIDGAVNYLAKDKNIKGQQHAWGQLKYPQSPPIGGRHNPNWQNCMGEIYDAPIASEHAVHSLEHGAIWLTYNPAKLNKQQIDALAAKVRGKDYAMMSPYEGLDKAVSVQAWGFQIKVDSPTDGRIDQFIKVTRKNASVEAGATCSGGITETGTTPRDLGKDQEQQQQQTGG